MSNYFRLKPLSLSAQLLHLQKNFPDGKGGIASNRLQWKIWIRPSAISRQYHLRLDYLLSSIPKIYIDDPCLQDLAGGKKLPHVYEENPARLCLYHPDYGEWQKDMSISSTLIPWASLWLFYFEDWLETNDWKGGGEHPFVKPSPLKV